MRPAGAALGTHIDSIMPAIAELQDMGVVLRFNALVDPETDRHAGYNYIGVLAMPDQETARTFEEAVEAAGFYDYFDQVNARDVVVPPEAVFRAMIEE